VFAFNQAWGYPRSHHGRENGGGYANNGYMGGSNRDGGFAKNERMQGWTSQTCGGDHDLSLPITTSPHLLKSEFHLAGLGAQLKAPDKEEWNKFDIPVFEKNFYRSPEI
jgi:hypothetical protein